MQSCIAAAAGRTYDSPPPPESNPSSTQRFFIVRVFRPSPWHVVCTYRRADANAVDV
jgi:hypothetical protein